MILTIVCKSFDGHPSLLREIEVLIDLRNFSSGLLHSAPAVELDLDVLLHYLRTSIEQNNVVSLDDGLIVGKEGV